MLESKKYHVMLKCDFLGLAGELWMLKNDTAFVLATLQADVQALERKKASTRHQQPFNSLDAYFLAIVLRTDHWTWSLRASL